MLFFDMISRLSLMYLYKKKCGKWRVLSYNYLKGAPLSAFQRKAENAFNMQRVSRDMVKRCTLKDIAQVTGLTVNSVSRALRDKSDIAPETKRRVMETAKELGYVPNFAASSLKKGKSFTVAIIFDNLFNPYYNIMTYYLTKYLSLHGYDFLTIINPNDKLRSKTFEKLLSKNVDGIISFLEPGEKFGEKLLMSRFPMTVIGRHCEQPRIDYVYTDDVRGGYLATEYLIKSGCKNLEFVADNLTVSCACERYEGFLRCVKENNVAYDKLLMDGQTYSEAIDKILKMRPDCDGIVCFNDYIATEAQYVLEEKNKSQIKVIGYDNIRQEFKLPGSYATISADKDVLAKIAVELLVQRMEGIYEGVSRRRVLEVELVAR